MTSIEQALTEAHEALESAIRALAVAEAAARAAGVEIRPATIEQLNVKQIRVVEDDGALRLILGNSNSLKTLALRGREVTHPGRKGAGVLFVNDEGTECGGLSWGGREGQQFVHLSLDSFEQNDALIIGHSDNGGQRKSSIKFVDRPDWSIADLLDQNGPATDEEEALRTQERHFGAGGGQSRMMLAREPDGAVRLSMRDAHGRDRIRLIVSVDGEPRIETLDADGVVTRLLP